MNQESKPGISREKFIRMGAALTLAPTGTAALSGCGGGTSSSGTGDATTQTTPPEETTSRTEPAEETTAPEEEPAEETTASGSQSAIASASDVPPNSAAEFEDAGQPAVLVHLDGGEFVAYSAVCTHRGCTVAYQPDSGELACPCHGSVFDPANGAAVVAGPAPSPLTEIPVAVSGDSVTRA